MKSAYKIVIAFLSILVVAMSFLVYRANRDFDRAKSGLNMNNIRFIEKVLIACSTHAQMSQSKDESAKKLTNDIISAIPSSGFVIKKTESNSEVEIFDSYGAKIGSFNTQNFTYQARLGPKTIQ